MGFIYNPPSLSGAGVAAGEANTGLGSEALAANEGKNNTAYGSRALKANTSGTANSAFGANALVSNTTGLQNVAVGVEAMAKNESGKTNTAVGYFALSLGTNTEKNTALGYQAVEKATGSFNTGVGWNAYRQNLAGERNTGVGMEAGASNKTGNKNVALGYAALAENATGSENVAVGTTALGTNSGGTNEGTAAKNVAVGFQCGEKNNGTGNVFLGFQAAQNETGNNLLYIANSNTTTPLIKGDFEGKTITVNGGLTTTAALSGQLAVAAPVGQVERAEKTGFEPSTTKPTSVLLQMEGPTLTRTRAKIIVEGNTIATPTISATVVGTNVENVTFLVPGGKKWEWEKVEGTPTVKTSYTVIG